MTGLTSGFRLTILAIWAAAAWPALSLPAAAADEALKLSLRSRVKNGDDQWKEQVADRTLAPRETAILICDMWDQHWCASASRRCGELARKMSPIIDAARKQGVHIIHCPSDTMEFYKDSPARKRILAMPRVEPPSPIARWCYLDPKLEGTLPIDDSDGGCDDEQPVKSYKAWTRQHPAINIHDLDVISESGSEVYNYLKHEGIKNIVYVGVHTNMCVLGRSFGIRQMTKLGFKTILVRDLTDTMYNPKQPPHVSHDAGTQLVIEHIEKHWCPTVESADLAEEF